MMTKPPKPIKITRQAIRETLKQTPIDQILVGAHNVDKVRLTKKQKDFARKVAEGKPKAQAYRESYNSKGKPTTEAVEGSKLASNPKIAQMIESFQLANEAREYLIPAQIRTMAIQNLVSIAINDDEKTSNKLKALELIGKMSEVSLFSETKTHVHLHSSEDIKTQLLEGLRQAFSNSRGINDLAKRKAESLLIELSEPADNDSDDEIIETPAHCENEIPADPPYPDPQKSTNYDSQSMHSIPLKQSDSNTLLADLTITAVIVTNPLESDTCPSIGVYPDAFKAQIEGVGVNESGQPAPEVPRETPPLTNPIEKQGE
jgi:hypothetical protein